MKPTSVEKRGREVLTCSHGDCWDHRIWDFPTCWKHLTEVEQKQLRERLAVLLRQKVSLKNIILTGADLHGFDFTGASLASAFLDHCDLHKTNFVDANLTNAYLGWANLQDADMSRAELHGAVFTNANLRGVQLLAYSLSDGRHPVNIVRHLFGEWSIFRSRMGSDLKIELLTLPGISVILCHGPKTTD
jgi:hypothetical protein